jgi:hypothetical protein
VKSNEVIKQRPQYQKVGAEDNMMEMESIPDENDQNFFDYS